MNPRACRLRVLPLFQRINPQVIQSSQQRRLPAQKEKPEVKWILITFDITPQMQLNTIERAVICCYFRLMFGCHDETRPIRRNLKPSAGLRGTRRVSGWLDFSSGSLAGCARGLGILLSLLCTHDGSVSLSLKMRARSEIEISFSQPDPIEKTHNADVVEVKTAPK